MTSTDRYQRMQYRRSGRSGLLLPAISLGGWQGMGSYVDAATTRAIVRTAFDHGITHFDFANNYGNPPGSSEELFGTLLPELPRHELVISSKAGYRMWPGPYGDWGSKKYLVESCEQSLRRLRLDHLDIFYTHRPDPETPIEETLGALDLLVRQGKALYAGISNYHEPHFGSALRTVKQRGWCPITIHQPRYNLLDRRAADSVLPTAAANGVGVIAFSPLAQGLLGGRYLDGIPADSRVARGQGNGALGRDRLTPAVLAAIRALDGLARVRGQTLAQMSLSWLLRDPRITSVLIGASRPEQVAENVACLARTDFAAGELAEIDRICAGAAG